MSLKEAQKMVDKWISQYEEGYWPPKKMLAQLLEEVGELVEETLRDSVMPVADNIEFLKAFELAIVVGEQARKAMDKSGRKRKEETNKKSSPVKERMNILFTLICMMNSEGADMDLAFVEMMTKERYGRDNDRFKKKKD